MADTQDVEALEALASTLTDSINGYEDAAENVSDAGIKNYLHEKAQARRGLVDEFKRHIAQRGGDASVGGSVTAAAHRAFLDLRSLFQDDTKAAVSEIERGEEYLRERFEECSADDRLSHDVRAFIDDAHAKARFDNATWDRLVQGHR